MRQQHLTRVLSAFLSFVMIFVMIPFATLIAFAETVENETETAQASAESNDLTSSETQLDHAGSLVNGINTYFDSYNRDYLYVENQNMKLQYVVAGDKNQQVGYIQNKNGGTYVSDTMDVYVSMYNDSTKTSSTRYYSAASNSFADAKMNIDLFGYYYYQTTVRDQDFLTNMLNTVLATGDNYVKYFKNPSKITSGADQVKYTLNSDGTYTFTLQENATDPYVYTTVTNKTNIIGQVTQHVGDFSYSAATYNYLRITMTVNSDSGATGSGQIFYNPILSGKLGSGFSSKATAEDGTEFTKEHSVSFTYARDEKEHTYYIPMAKGYNYSGSIIQLRLDLAGDAGDTFVIKEITPVQCAENVPQNLLLKRYFATHSDRLNQRIQVVTNNTPTQNIAEIGMETKVEKSTVDGIVVKDKNGFHYSLYTLSTTVTDSADPNIDFQDLNIPMGDYDKFRITMRSSTATQLQVFFAFADDTTTALGHAEDSSKKAALAPGNDYETVEIDISTIAGYNSGYLRHLRLDLYENQQAGTTWDVKSMELVNSTTGETRSILITPQAVSRVVDVETPTCTLIVDWTTAEYVGFDIHDVGIFGYILLQDGNGDKLTVTDDKTNFVIAQTRTPENNTILNSGVYEKRTVNNKEYTRYWQVDGLTEDNGNDFYMQQRIYTDTNTSFDEFIKEAEFERNPLDESDFIIYADESTLDPDAGEGADGFLRYDAWTGAYILQMDSDGFNGPFYNYPNRHWNIKFAVKAKEGDIYDRDVYIHTYIVNGGCLECAAILDSNDMMLPMSIEVCKNFSEAGGERDIYNINDSTYSYAIFPLTVEANKTTEPLNFISIMQNWGNYPNSQISSIQFYCPYYHLSTGTTESNCIVPWYQTNGNRGLTTLPDHRAASAPFWPNQPQHNSAGSHRWLYYTTVLGQNIMNATNIVTSENTKNTVGSSGPIYADVTMEYKSDDGKITLIYNHMEMPHTDENRAYYEMKYVINENITFDNFHSQFQLFSVTDNDPTGVYQRIGYLDSNNKSAYVANKYASDSSDITITKYTLGKQSPYFTFFDMDNYTIGVNFNAAGVAENGYSNVSFLVRDYSVVNSAGADITPNLALVNVGNRVALTFDETSYTLAEGTVITINAIVMPWGSQEMESDQEYWANDGDDSTVDVDYDDIINTTTNEKYLDKNVRDVRYNSCLNPFVATSTTDTVLGDSFVYCDVECSDKIYINLPDLAKIKSNDGETATFTVRGGANNMAIRVYGFNKLTVPKIEEYVNGKWVEYDVSSYNNLDSYYYGYAYDGYAVYDDGETYSYAFIANMGKVEVGDSIPSRTFRVTCTEDFTTWEDRGLNAQFDIPLNTIYKGLALKQAISSANSRTGIAKYGVVTENGTDFVRLYADDVKYYEKTDTTPASGTAESFFTVKTDGSETGQYFVIKYRFPETLSTSSGKISSIQMYTDTDGENVTEADSKMFSATNDGEWNIAIVDLTKYPYTKDGVTTNTFVAATDGKYYAKFLRVDFFNYDATSEDPETYLDNDYIDIEYMGLCNDVEEILAFERTNSPTEFRTKVSFAENIVVSNTRYDINANSIDGNLLITNEKIASLTRGNITFTPAVDGENNNLPYTKITSSGDDNAEQMNVVYGNSAGTYLTSRAGAYIGMLYRSTTAHPIDFWISSSGGEVGQNYERLTATVSDTWQYAVIPIKNTVSFNEATGISFIRFDYFNGTYVAADAELDVAFFSFFESEENAYEYYDIYRNKYALACDHEAAGSWIHGKEKDTKLCIICGEVAESRNAVHTTPDEWTHGKEKDTKTCSGCGAIIESRDAVHTYKTENPWYHVQGEPLEAKDCTVCGATTTRNTLAVGWIAMAGASSTSLRSNLNDKIKDASSLVLSFDETHGYYLYLTGEWVAVNGGVYNYFYKINEGEWKDFGYVHYQDTVEYVWGKAYLDGIGTSLGNAAASSAKGGIVSVSGKPKYIELGDVKGNNISIKIGIAPYENQGTKVEIFEFTNIMGPEYFTEGLTFEKNADGNGYIVTGYTGEATEIVIPSTYRNLPVTQIAEGAITCDMLKNELTINCEGYTYENGLLIEDATSTVIAGCATDVTIPEGIKRISTQAFYGCTDLQSLSVPSTVQSIGNNAFAGCTSLASIYYANSAAGWDRLSTEAGISTLPEYTFGLTIVGDLNGDGQITSFEVAVCARYLASKDPATGETSMSIDPNADINEDGKINMLDLIKMRQTAVSQ